MMASAFTVGASASSAYQTYTYSINGSSLYSPDAYSATETYDYLAMGLDKNLDSPSDLTTDADRKVYIADSKNNRIIVLDSYFKLDFTIDEFINSQGNNDALTNPQGIFVNEESIWVCDTDKNRLVEFDKAGNFQRIVDAPESQLFGENSVFKPIAMAIDQYGRIYVVSSSNNQGVIVMDNDGGFVGFIGAQAVSLSAWVYNFPIGADIIYCIV